eukprot:TRINITY_DN17654_c0_g1_i3.p1 TRINITY_DN17654_c0_g1~~TRINITY_DN17654_c0_g1_i3.p1  ORF type:complete len:673 (-),score=161.37 TRINITY_DN17654_c0_g1_i3:697-2715(-)
MPKDYYAQLWHSPKIIDKNELESRWGEMKNAIYMLEISKAGENITSMQLLMYYSEMARLFYSFGNIDQLLSLLAISKFQGIELDESCYMQKMERFTISHPPPMPFNLPQQTPYIYNKSITPSGKFIAGGSNLENLGELDTNKWLKIMHVPFVLRELMVNTVESNRFFALFSSAATKVLTDTNLTKIAVQGEADIYISENVIKRKLLTLCIQSSRLGLSESQTEFWVSFGEIESTEMKLLNDRNSNVSSSLSIPRQPTIFPFQNISLTHLDLSKVQDSLLKHKIFNSPPQIFTDFTRKRQRDQMDDISPVFSGGNKTENALISRPSGSSSPISGSLPEYFMEQARDMVSEHQNGFIDAQAWMNRKEKALPTDVVFSRATFYEFRKLIGEALKTMKKSDFRWLVSHRSMVGALIKTNPGANVELIEKVAKSFCSSYKFPNIPDAENNTSDFSSSEDNNSLAGNDTIDKYLTSPRVDFDDFFEDESNGELNMKNNGINNNNNNNNHNGNNENIEIDPFPKPAATTSSLATNSDPILTNNSPSIPLPPPSNCPKVTFSPSRDFMDLTLPVEVKKEIDYSPNQRQTRQTRRRGINEIQDFNGRSSGRSSPSLSSSSLSSSSLSVKKHDDKQQQQQQHQQLFPTTSLRNQKGTADEGRAVVIRNTSASEYTTRRTRRS